MHFGAEVTLVGWASVGPNGSSGSSDQQINLVIPYPCQVKSYCPLITEGETPSLARVHKAAIWEPRVNLGCGSRACWSVLGIRQQTFFERASWAVEACVCSLALLLWQESCPVEQVKGRQVLVAVKLDI